MSSGISGKVCRMQDRDVECGTVGRLAIYIWLEHRVGENIT